MGLYAALRPENASVAQLVATTAKVPLLFLLTLAVTFPSLYVMSALSNSRLGAPSTLRLLLVAISVNLALLASLGPVTGFFTLSTESYPFMVTLNVVFFGVAGLVGLTFLRRALDAVFAPPPPPPLPPPPPPVIGAEDVAVEPERRILRVAELRVDASQRPRRIFGVWLVIYGVVGAQMGWILRPFVGSPTREFELFRERDSNFFEAIIATLQRLFA